MKNFSISNKIHVPLIDAILLGMVLIIFSAWQSLKNIENDVFQKGVQELQVYLENKLNSKYDIGLTNVIISDNTRSIKEIAGAAEHLDSMTDNLNQTLGTFKT